MYLSSRTQLRLAQVIAQIAEGEKRTEMVRQVLAEQKLFEPYTTFKRLDQSRTGEITVTDIIDFLRDNKLAVTAKEADYLFRRFDVDRNGRITYPEYQLRA
jgi:Ca2+-binding EF-hand superfamily protein